MLAAIAFADVDAVAEFMRELYAGIDVADVRDLPANVEADTAYRGGIVAAGKGQAIRERILGAVHMAAEQRNVRLPEPAVLLVASAILQADASPPGRIAAFDLSQGAVAGVAGEMEVIRDAGREHAGIKIMALRAEPGGIDAAAEAILLPGAAIGRGTAGALVDIEARIEQAAQHPLVQELLIAGLHAVAALAQAAAVAASVRVAVMIGFIPDILSGWLQRPGRGFLLCGSLRITIGCAEDIFGLFLLPDAAHTVMQCMAALEHVQQAAAPDIVQQQGIVAAALGALTGFSGILVAVAGEIPELAGFLGAVIHIGEIVLGRADGRRDLIGAVDTIRRSRPGRHAEIFRSAVDAQQRLIRRGYSSADAACHDILHPAQFNVEIGTAALRIGDRVPDIDLIGAVIQGLSSCIVA